MLKMARSFTKWICVLTIVFSSFCFVACNTPKENKVMAIGFNPQIQFVLNGENKVVSVTALNEEGNLIISADAFINVEGKSAEDAAELFLSVSKEYGFLVSGNATINGETNEFSISISGEDAQALYNKVKDEIQDYCSTIDIQASVAELEKITKAQLEELVAEYAPYLTTSEIAAMDYSALVQNVKQAHEETAEFCSQELKRAYYEAKALAIQQAELNVLKSKLGPFAQGVIESVNSIYVDAVENVESIRQDMLLAEDSIYQQALASFREAKAEYLNYRNYVAGLEQTDITTQISEALANYQVVVDNAEAALLQAGEQANSALDTAKSSLAVAYDTVINAIEQAAVNATDYVDEISTAQTQAIKNLTTSFETEYTTLITKAEADWNAMRATLEQGYQPTGN